MKIIKKAKGSLSYTNFSRKQGQSIVQQKQIPNVKICVKKES